MFTLLLPVDGSEHSLRAVDAVLGMRAAGLVADVHLLNVQIPVDSGHARMFVGQQAVEEFHREEGRAALEAARARLDAAGVPYSPHLAIGHVAETIARYAQQHAVDQIVMGSHGRGALTHLLLGSVASDVIRLVTVPVTLVK